MKIGIIGDAHFKDFLSYSDYIDDRRVTEKKEILDFVVKSFEDCEHIVFLGDNFHSKNNSSETNREFVEFIEKFGNKDIYLISGNHEKKGDGKTAIDFLKEIKKDNWHVYTKFEGGVEIGDLIVDFLPYMLNSELKSENGKESVSILMNKLKGADILFTHHNITGTSLFNGLLVDMVSNIVLPREELEKKYKLIVAGDIHVPQEYGKVIISGSLFTSDVGEIEKFIWKVDENLQVEKLKVPARPLFKLTNPSDKQLSKIPNNAIIKVIITDESIDVELLKKELIRFDASLLIEDYPNERAKMHIEQGAIDFNIESLLKMYSDVKKIDYQKLIRGLALLND